MNSTLQLLAQNQTFHHLGGIMIVLLAAITAFLANRHIAVFNDGVRPLVGQAKQGNLKYKALAGMSFSMSIGYVIGFIPFSLVQNILIMHTILLGSEMIGLMFKKDIKHTIVAVILAAALAAGIFWGLSELSTAINKISYPNFGFDLGLIIDGAFPFVFAMFPAVAVLIQSGPWKGLAALTLSITVYILISAFGWTQAHLYPMAITLLVGTGVLFAFAVMDHMKAKKIAAKEATKNEVAEDAKKPSKAKVFSQFNDNANLIIKNKWFLAISGAIAAMAVTSFATAPLVSMALQTTASKPGSITSALIADTTWFIGFIPLVVLTALLTGVYSPVGLTAVFVWADISKLIGAAIVSKTHNQDLYLIAVILSGVFGATSLFAETYLLKGIATLLQKVPGIQKLSDSMRTSISTTINYAFLIGGIIAAYMMGTHVASHIHNPGLAFWLPSLGAGIVITLLVINKFFKKKLAEIAIGPAGAILAGVVFNVIYFIA